MVSSLAVRRRRPFAFALVLVIVAGCGMQDLYEPPTAPYSVVGRLSLPSEVEDISVLGDYAYLAAGEAGLIIVDISDPADPVLVKMIDTVKYAESIKTASTYYAGAVVDIAFVVEGTEGITTYDITDPENAFSFNQGTTAVDGNGLFIELPDDPTDPYIVYLAESWKGIRIFESDESIPGLLQYNGVFSTTYGYARAITVRDGWAYVADNQMGVAVLDVRTRVLGAVEVVASCDTDGEARGIDISGDYLYVADEANGLVVMEIRMEGDPPVPTPYEVGHLDLDGWAFDIVVRDNKAFIAGHDGGAHVVDVSNPSSPRWLGTEISSYATGIALSKTGIVAVSDRDEGLLLLKGSSFSDPVAPAEVTDLAAAGIDSSTIRLTWTATGDDRLSGTASIYDLRYSLTPIDSIADWNAAVVVDSTPLPLPRGNAESFDVTGLSPATKYYFGLKTGDAVPNWSAISNIASATTPQGNVPPSLVVQTVSPEGGTVDSTYTFEVTYTDGDGDAPVEKNVSINGAEYGMTLVSGDYESGALFRYQTALPVGSYDYTFTFSDGYNDAVSTQVVSGPYVGISVFLMGSPEDEAGRRENETRHTVVLQHSFWMSDHEVTQEEYSAVMDTNPSRFSGEEDFPVENVTWYDAVAYCNALSADSGYTQAYSIEGSIVIWNEEADGFRLPTEAEWEQTCRAGVESAFTGGDITDEGCGIDPVLDTYGWYCGNSDESPHDVMDKTPNAEGMYDMHGNVWEWCWDWYVADPGSVVAADPAGPPGGSQKTVRGGSWYYFARECRSASRAAYWPNSKDDVVGFRVVRAIP